MFVAVTKHFPRDAWDDVSKKQCRTTYNSLRCINDDKASKNNDTLYPDHKLTSIVGHSFCGSLVSEMQKPYPYINFKTTTYGAPVASMTAPDNINTKKVQKL